MTLWLVGQFKAITQKGNVWEFQGVFSTQELAEKACVSEYYFVTPITVDVPSPDETCKFSGSYYPVKED